MLLLLQLTKSIYDKLNCYLRSADQSIIKRPFQQFHNYCINQTSTQDRDRPQETGGRVLSFIPSVIILLWWWPRQLVFFAQLVGWWFGGALSMNQQQQPRRRPSTRSCLWPEGRQPVRVVSCSRHVSLHIVKKWVTVWWICMSAKNGNTATGSLVIIIARNILYNYCHVIIKRWSHAHRSLREAAYWSLTEPPPLAAASVIHNCAENTNWPVSFTHFAPF